MLAGDELMRVYTLRIGLVLALVVLGVSALLAAIQPCPTDLAFRDSAGNLSLEFGPQLVGTTSFQQLQITNVCISDGGCSTYSVDSVSITGANQADFQASGSFPLSV